MMDEDRAVLLAFVWTLAGFKLLTSILILWFFPSIHALILVLALSVPWIVGGIVYGGIYSRVRFRLLRARARRKHLIYEEWHLD